MSIPGENIVTLPDRKPEVTLGIADVRKVHAAGRLGGLTVTQAAAMSSTPIGAGGSPSSFRPVTNPQTAVVLGPVMAASWDNLSVRLTPGPGFLRGVFTIVCAWSHSEIALPSGPEEVASLPGACTFFFGNTPGGPTQPPDMLSPCPFVMGISHQAKPRDIYGGHPVFVLSCFSSSAPSSAGGSEIVVHAFFHGDLSVKGSDIMIA